MVMMLQANLHYSNHQACIYQTFLHATQSERKKIQKNKNKGHVNIKI
jgi:hypothetical protein